MHNRAYSLFEIKAVDDEKRILEGIASTPQMDRYNDVVLTDGIEFNLPLPFLNQHRSSEPIGTVISAKKKSDGLEVRVQMAKAGIAAYIDTAWAQIKEGLVRGLSIGFRSLEESYDRETGGFRFLRSELMEISAVTIPANADCTISAVKSYDLGAPAMSGHTAPAVVKVGKSNRPGVPGLPVRHNMTIKEQIDSFENKRAANVARMEALMTKAAEEGRTSTEEEITEYETLDSELRSIDGHLVRLKNQEKLVIQRATPVNAATVNTAEGASAVRGGSVVTVKSNLPQGIAFARYAMALASAKGDILRAAEIAKARWADSSPEVERVLRTAAVEGTTLGNDASPASGWGGSISDYTYMASEFIDFLRPQTIVGRIQGLRRIPFNVKIPLQDAGSSVQWVGEAQAKPVTAISFDTTTFRFAKIAGLIVLTDELVRFSNPSAEALVRQDLAAAITQFMDEQFINPAVTAVANVSPASVTNSAPTSVGSNPGSPPTGSGTADDLRQDFKLIAASFNSANIPLTDGTWVMQPPMALAISLMLNPLGQPEFPGINANGGTLFGYPVVTSMSVPSGDVVFLKPSEILYADDGAIALDASREATVTMDNGLSPHVATQVSLWQQNMVAIRAERIVNWARRRTNAVYVLTGCTYGG